MQLGGRDPAGVDIGQDRQDDGQDRVDGCGRRGHGVQSERGTIARRGDRGRCLRDP